MCMNSCRIPVTIGKAKAKIKPKPTNQKNPTKQTKLARKTFPCAVKVSTKKAVKKSPRERSSYYIIGMFILP